MIWLTVRALALFGEYPVRVMDRFEDFHAANPHIYEKFRELALVKLNAGFKKYSARTIVERMRWDYELPTTGDPFKINDDFVPIYARLLIYHEPRFTDFFELRQVRSQGQKSKEQLMREAVV